MEQYKTCATCLQSLSIINFGKDKTCKDGFRYSCKQCRNKSARDQYSNRKDYWITYRKNNPEKTKLANARYRKINGPKLLQTQKQDRIKNPEKYLEKARRHRANNPGLYSHYFHSRRDRLRSNGSFVVTKHELKRLLDSGCFYCGQKATTIDHVVPVSRGGRHSIGNLVGACLSCNASKNSKFLFEWKLWKRNNEEVRLSEVA